MQPANRKALSQSHWLDIEGPYETSNLLTTVAAAMLLAADSFTVCFKIPSFSNSLNSMNGTASQSLGKKSTNFTSQI